MRTALSSCLRTFVFAVVSAASVSACSDTESPKGCESDCAYTPPAGFVTDQRIIYTDGLHNENTEMLALDDRILLIFRGGETGQVGSDRAHINVYASKDGGKSFEKQSEVSAAGLPGQRDIRDPKLVSMNGKVYMYAISRLPGGHYRDLLGEAWTVRAESSDKGLTWTDPVQTFEDSGEGKTFWGFWRFTKRAYTDSTGSHETLYALGYNDGDTQVGLFASNDGVSWEKRTIVVDSYEDVPSEAELQFFGENQETAVAIVRMDNQGILQDGQSAICTSHEPFTTWECGRRIEQRLDGPTWISREIGGTRRNFVVARKHLPCTYKRTAVYELKGDLTDPKAPIEVCEIETLISAGDTAYTALAPLGDDRFLVSWYSSVVPNTGDTSWLEGTYAPADIWLADLDLAKASPTECHPPPAKVACTPPPVPAGSVSSAKSGDFFLTLAPVIYPKAGISFTATMTVHDGKLDLSMQPLDGNTRKPIGDTWDVTGVPIDANGHFKASFDGVPLPEKAFTLLADPFLILNELVFEGTWISSDLFCGNLSGYAQVFGDSPSDRMDLLGSTFGAARVEGATIPTAVVACPTP